MNPTTLLILCGFVILVAILAMIITINRVNNERAQAIREMELRSQIWRSTHTSRESHKRIASAIRSRKPAGSNLRSTSDGDSVLNNPLHPLNPLSPLNSTPDDDCRSSRRSFDDSASRSSHSSYSSCDSGSSSSYDSGSSSSCDSSSSSSCD